MSNFIITCPNCFHKFEPTDAIRENLQKELNEKAKEWQEKKEKEFRDKESFLQQQLINKEEELNTRLTVEKQKLEEIVKKKVSTDFENKLQALEQTLEENKIKLKESRNKELEFLQKERELINKEAELQITLQKQLLIEREKLKEQLLKEEADRYSIKDHEYQLQVKELQKQLEDQKRLADEMKRKAEQGSMQLQGEVQELLLEEILRNTFPFDKIEEVGKGVKGADCIQTVRTQFGNEAGTIIYESKRTKDFANEWIEKLKSDMRVLGADIAVIVTQALPKEIEKFGEKEGVYICTFSEVKSVALILRNAVVKVYEAKKSQENKGDKMTLLYDYLISNEFGEQWKAIREGFMSMKLSIQKERDAMEKLWKAREKQLEKVLLNAAHIKGSIEGISGADINLNLLDDNDSLLLE